MARDILKKQIYFSLLKTGSLANAIQDFLLA